MLAQVFFKLEYDGAVWLGARRVGSLDNGNMNGNETYFLWFSGDQPEMPTPKSSGYYNPYRRSNWISSEALFMEGDCLQMMPKGDANAGKWAPTDCDRKLAFFCTKRLGYDNPTTIDIEGSCESKLDGKKYVVYN